MSNSLQTIPLPSSGSNGKGWPSWLSNGRPNFGIDRPSAAETFDLDVVHVTAEDDARHQGDPDHHMRQLLSGAIGDGEGNVEDASVKEGEDIIEGFAKGVRLMPHQVRGVKWMRGRESGRKCGGILADVSVVLHHAMARFDCG